MDEKENMDGHFIEPIIDKGHENVSVVWLNSPQDFSTVILTINL
jgi:hypothetical protein